jgi:hypothetical protein
MVDLVLIVHIQHCSCLFAVLLSISVREQSKTPHIEGSPILLDPRGIGRECEESKVRLH